MGHIKTKMGHVTTVTVSDQSKVEFLMLVNMAMGLKVGQELSIDENMHHWVISFEGSIRSAEFFGQLHENWVNKDLNKSDEKETIELSVPNQEITEFAQMIQARFFGDEIEFTVFTNDFRGIFTCVGSPEDIQDLDEMHTKFRRNSNN